MKRFSFELAACITAMTMLLGSCSGGETTAQTTTTTGSAPAQTAAEQSEASATEAASEQTESSEETTPAQTDAAEKDVSEMTPEEQREAIVKRSFLSAGNGDRLRKVFEKAANGEEITVSYIGGSITEGYTTGNKLAPEECWAYLTYDYLCKKYPDAKINYVNAGLSGTPSMLGLIRSDRDLLAPHGDPDIVFIEFAVNDSDDPVMLEAYESLVRKMYDLDTEPAVIQLFMRTRDGYSVQNKQSLIGHAYSLPMITINDATTWAFDNGIMTWDDYSEDESHPYAEGCKLVAEMIEYMYECENGERESGLEEEPAVASAADVTPVYGADFVNMHMYDAASIEPVSMGEYEVTAPLASFPNAWTRITGENEGLSFDMTFDDLFVVYHCNKSKRFGTLEVYVDGELAGEVETRADDGWSNPVPQLVMRGDGVKEHTVEFKVKGDAEKAYIGLLALGYTD